ncbi:MAG TPA: glucose 1-dehydrogenase [Polyangia bacterium]|jgi:NAD(P)-dependent dehydrogenase (short-subunit alcohol dehydrogenase family)
MDPLIQLEGKVAVITGASRGIGAAIARGFAAHGARVVLAARKPEGLTEVAAAIQAGGGQALTRPCHMGRADDVRALFAAAVARFGQVDVLVNNAATNPYFGPLCDITDAAFDKTIEVNLKGYFVAARELIRHVLGRQGTGAIVNIASVVGMRGAPFQGAYAMTKAAILSMTQTLAVEVGGRGIRVNAIAPGLIETRFAAALTQSDTVREMWLGRTPAARLGQPEDVTGAALFLASDAASYVNGATLVVDGGFLVS